MHAINATRKPSKRLTTTLSENLRGHRHSKNFSQEQLAELSGLHRTYVGSVERGERNVTLSTLEALATALNVTVPHLLTRKATRGGIDDRASKLR